MSARALALVPAEALQSAADSAGLVLELPSVVEWVVPVPLWAQVLAVADSSESAVPEAFLEAFPLALPLAFPAEASFDLAHFHLEVRHRPLQAFPAAFLRPLHLRLHLPQPAMVQELQLAQLPQVRLPSIWRVEGALRYRHDQICAELLEIASIL